ncbi:hypothetical protein EMCG_07766 [[Emmonsia] crescens]|uniref:Uncharacterized protein n=1 Tax=[Emmonsia] crescens TaxID=73230 RepID=A0A0G2JAX4_9EURO|nr:hypothetical protein EMCG_07766 [Emmonsia crescens UAMH 3008]
MQQGSGQTKLRLPCPSCDFAFPLEAHLPSLLWVAFSIIRWLEFSIHLISPRLVGLTLTPVRIWMISASFRQGCKSISAIRPKMRLCGLLYR